MPADVPLSRLLAERGAAMPMAELAALAQVAPRTVRYYITQGLLPPPLTTGRTATYGMAHLWRLVIIRARQADGLALQAIRAQLGSLDDATLQQRAIAIARSQEDRAATPSHADELRISSARRLLDQAAPTSMPDATLSSTERCWRRLPITPEAELLLESDAYDQLAPHLPTLLQMIRGMLGRG